MKRYNDYATYIKTRFGQRIQKVSVNAGFSCPNRDGTLGLGGCTYCNNQSFNPYYCKPETSISTQINHGIDFFGKRYGTQSFLAYFQSYTNTYQDVSLLEAAYNEALANPLIKGLVIGTRPDCMPDEALDLLEVIARRYYVSVEYGIESTNNDTLQRIHRGHSYEQAKEAIQKTAARKLDTGAHVIMGLPGESRSEMLHRATELSELPITTLKLHHLQIIKQTQMAYEYAKHPDHYELFGLDEYLRFSADFLERLHPRIVVERFISESPPDLLIAPQWGIKNFQFTQLLDKLLDAEQRQQGSRLSEVSKIADA